MGIIVGSNTPMNDEKANEILEPFLDFEPSFTNIAFNNIVNNLLIFTPGIGVLLLAYSSYNAGLVLAAVSFQTGLSDLSYFMMLLYNPVFWIEVIVFCLAATQGVMFLIGWLTRRRSIEGRTTLIVMVVCFSRLSGGLEITALSAPGISLYQLLVLIVLFAGVMFTASLSLTLPWGPWGGVCLPADGLSDRQGTHFNSR